MPYVFVSYAREDSEFVRELCAALTSGGREVWVDWQGLSPTAEWMAEIYTAIDGADAFLFVISADSVQSQVCQLEIARAANQKKRLLPVVRRSVDAELVPAPLRPINWIFWRESDPADIATSTILQAISLDVERARAHTRLLVHASDWDGRGRDGSLVLRGSELREAERWLATARDDQPPQPTALHTQFILASRKAATKGQRRLLALVSAGMVGATILALVAYRAERRAAEEQRLAEAGQLSATAINSLSTDPELALLVGLEAASRGRGTDGAIPVEVQDALHRVLQSARTEYVVHNDGGLLRAVAYSPDGRVIAAADPEGVKLRDAVTGALLETRLDQTSSALSVTFSPDGTLLAAGGRSGTVSVWDPATGRLARRLEGHESGIWSVAFSPDGRLLASAGMDGTARLWDAATGRALRILKGHTGSVNGLAFSPDGTLLATTGDDTTWRLWDTTSGREVRRGTSPDNRLRAIAFSPRGDEFATGGLASTAVTIWSVALGRELRSFDGHTASLFVVAYSPDGKRLLTASQDKTARIWDTATGESVATLTGHSSTVTCAAFSVDNGHVVTGDEEGMLRISTAAEPYELPPLIGHTGAVTGVAFAPDGDTVATSSTDNTARVWDVDTGQELVTMSDHRSTVNGVAIAPDGRYFATASNDGSAKVIEIATGHPVRSLVGDHGAVNHVAYSGDGTRIATALDDHAAIVWDAATGRRLSTISTDEGRVVGTDLNRDGTRVAVSIDDRTGKLGYTAQIWDVATGRRLVPLRADFMTVNQVLFNPDSTRLITVGTTPPFTTTVWDTVSGSPRFTLARHRAGVLAAAISRDETYLATAGYDAVTHVWDSWTGAEMFTLGADTPRRINSVAFSRDGARLATGAGDRIVRLYAVDPGELITIARARVTRALTAEECVRYLHQKDCSMRSTSLVLEGKQQLLAGNSDTALATFRRAAAIGAAPDPDAEARSLVVQLRTRESRARAEAGDLAGATAALSDVKRLDAHWRHEPSSEASRLVASSLVRQASDLSAADNPSRAIAVLRRATALDSTSLEANRALGSALVDAERYAEAVDVRRRVLQLSPTVANRILLSNALRLQRRYDDAIAQARQAIADDPHNEWAHRVLAVAYSDRHDPGRALAELDAAIAIEPTLEAFSDKARLLVAASDYKGALGALDRAKALNPKNVSVRRRASGIYLEHLRDFDAAYRELQATRPLAPANTGLQADFAEVAMVSGHLDEAFDAATALLSLPRSRDFTISDEAAMRLVVLVVFSVTGRAGEASAARAELLEMLASAPPYPDTWNYDGTLAYLQRAPLDAGVRSDLIQLVRRLEGGKPAR